MEKEKIDEVYVKLREIIESPNFAVSDQPYLELDPKEKDDSVNKKLADYIENQKDAVEDGDELLNRAEIDVLVRKITDLALNLKIINKLLANEPDKIHTVHHGALEKFFNYLDESQTEKLGNLGAFIYDPEEEQNKNRDGFVTYYRDHVNVACFFVPFINTKLENKHAQRVEGLLLHELQHVIDRINGIPGIKAEPMLTAGEYKKYLSHISEARAHYRQLQFLVKNWGVDEVIAHYYNVIKDEPENKDELEVFITFLQSLTEKTSEQKSEELKNSRITTPRELSPETTKELNKIRRDLKIAIRQGKEDEIAKLKKQMEDLPNVSVLYVNRVISNISGEEEKKQLDRRPKQIAKLEQSIRTKKGIIGRGPDLGMSPDEIQKIKDQIVEHEKEIRKLKIYEESVRIGTLTESKQDDLQKIHNIISGILYLFNPSSLEEDEEEPDTAE